uniref:Uncharacterized protein n=1 Tax=Anguilla anguilla TaxID=7936 RepID=A0A0E9TT93_ANGAN
MCSLVYTYLNSLEEDGRVLGTQCIFIKGVSW